MTAEDYADSLLSMPLGDALNSLQRQPYENLHVILTALLTELTEGPDRTPRGVSKLVRLCEFVTVRRKFAELSAENQAQVASFLSRDWENRMAGRVTPPVALSVASARALLSLAKGAANPNLTFLVHPIAIAVPEIADEVYEVHDSLMAAEQRTLARGRRSFLHTAWRNAPRTMALSLLTVVIAVLVQPLGSLANILPAFAVDIVAVLAYQTAYQGSSFGSGLHPRLFVGGAVFMILGFSALPAVAVTGAVSGISLWGAVFLLLGLLQVIVVLAIYARRGRAANWRPQWSIEPSAAGSPR